MLAAERSFGAVLGSSSVSARFEGGVCVVEARLDKYSDNYDERLTPANVRIVREPTIGARHNAAIQIEGLPDVGVKLDFDCSFPRNGNGLPIAEVYCNSLDKDALVNVTQDLDDVEEIVIELADQVMIDQSGIDLEAPHGLLFPYSTSLSPSDVLALTPTSPELSLTEISDGERVRARTLRRMRILERAGETEAGVNALTTQSLSMACVIQGDLSLACVKPDTGPRELVAIGYSIASTILAPVTLKDGASSVGRTVRVPVVVKFADP
jgi:hypothetical protein